MCYVDFASAACVSCGYFAIGSSDSRECSRNSRGSPCAGVTASFLLSSLFAVFCFTTCFLTNFENVLNLRCYFLVFLASVLGEAVITDFAGAVVMTICSTIRMGHPDRFWYINFFF